MKKVKFHHDFIKRYAFYLLLSISLLGVTGCSATNSQSTAVEVVGEVDSTNTSSTTEVIQQEPVTENQQQTEGTTDQTTNNPVSETKVADAEIHFIDTGNSDAILIVADHKAMLIDGGDNDDEGLVVDYLKNQGITELEYVVATHPHADHIGGLDAVIKVCKVNKLLVANGDADTKTYRDFINAAMAKGLTPSVPLEESKFPLGSSYFTVMNTEGAEDANNQSLVIEYVNGEDTVLFMGDAEKEVEEKLLSHVSKVDLLKVGHHGSSTSTTDAFLKKVDPTYAVILCGKENKYGHPHRETMLKLQGIEVHRSDECGTIIFKSTGTGLVTDCKAGSYTPGSDTQSSTSGKSESGKNNTNTTTTDKGSANEENTEVEQQSQGATNSGSQVYWTPNGKSYHTTKSCPTLSRSKTILSGTISESGKDDPCDRCH